MTRRASILVLCLSLLIVATAGGTLLAVRAESAYLFVRERARKARLNPDDPLLLAAAEPRCDEVGLCAEGERRLVVPSRDPNILAAVEKQGCRIAQLLAEAATVVCPRGAVVAQARAERLFQLADTLSAMRVRAPSVQARGYTGKGVRVAILDGGVDGAHPELAGRVAAEVAFTAEDGIPISHGTHVAGIVAGRGVKNLPGAAAENRARGVAPGAEILSAKVCSGAGWCPEGDVVAGIEWAVAMGARVINLSLGFGRFAADCDDDFLASEVNWAVARGSIVTVATGNVGRNGAGVASPACASKAVAVGAIDDKGGRPVWSGYGAPLDLVAPGTLVASPVSCAGCPHPWYSWRSGTSMAAPHAAGVAALLLEADPSLAPGDVANLLARSADDLGPPGRDMEFGFGLINAERALALLLKERVRKPAVTGAKRTARTFGGAAALCTDRAWSCRPFGACQANGTQIYACTLADRACANPQAARPPSVRACSQ